MLPGMISLTLLAIGLVARCGADTSPEGNAFRAEARVVSVGEHDFTATVVDIEDAEGNAKGTLDLGEKVVFYSRYQDKGCKTHNVGSVQDDDGDKMQLSDLQPGTTLEIVGSVHDDISKCAKKIPDIQTIPVYRTAQVVHR